MKKYKLIHNGLHVKAVMTIEQEHDSEYYVFEAETMSEIECEIARLNLR